MDKLDKWFLRRWSKFTASEAYKLLVPGTKGEMFGTGACSYIEQKALELTTTMQERPEVDEAKSILHGKAHEYPAYVEYVQRTNNNFVEYLGEDNPLFYPYKPLVEEAGGTPDCASITDSGLIDMGAEIKCPKNPINHFRRLKWRDQFDVKENYIQAYTQCQKLMMCTGARQWDFVSFDDRQIVQHKKIKIIPIYPDKKFQDNYEIRLRQAIKEKYRIISENYGIVVVNRSDFMNKFNLIAQTVV